MSLEEIYSSVFEDILHRDASREEIVFFLNTKFGLVILFDSYITELFKKFIEEELDRSGGADERELRACYEKLVAFGLVSAQSVPEVDAYLAQQLTERWLTLEQNRRTEQLLEQSRIIRE